MKAFSHTSKDIGYGWRWTFDNGLRFDIIDYRKQDKVILRVGRWAWLVKQYPILYGMFDQVTKVIAKIEIHSMETLQEKGILGLLDLLDNTPKEPNYNIC